MGTDSAIFIALFTSNRSPRLNRERTRLPMKTGEVGLHMNSLTAVLRMRERNDIHKPETPHEKATDWRLSRDSPNAFDFCFHNRPNQNDFVSLMGE
jgi:hypothetical protein